MKMTKKSVTVKGYKKKHKFEIEKTELSGYVFYSLKKNGNNIVKCTPEEYLKLKSLFSGGI